MMFFSSRIYKTSKRSIFLRQLHFCKMMSTQDIFSDAKDIFHSSVQSVLPKKLISNSLNVEKNCVEIQNKQFFVNKNVHVIGFGKAVLGMALEMDNLLQNHIVSGIISIPTGLKYNGALKNKEKFLSRFQLLEGAQNNIPDKNSELAAHKIFDLVISLKSSDILFVLISGGGSALLSYPKPPLTLEEKKQVIKVLASKGATIEEINTVRKRLSVLKGGSLAELAKPDKVVSFILSDIIGDPLELIASGPTVENVDDPSLPLKIIEKYKVFNDFPQAAIKLLTEKLTTKHNTSNHVHNFIIGNNSMALEAAANKAKELFYRPIILTNQLSGRASVVGCKIIQLIDAALSQNQSAVVDIFNELKINKKHANTLLFESKNIQEKSRGLCILFGGETTVEVKGKGIGGRNQELALAASLELNRRKPKNEIVLLSAGTDGIDGPTDAAGAIATSSVIGDADAENLNPVSHLQDNDSYSFYRTLSNGQYQLRIGHTGTNVMDIVIVLVKHDG